MAIKDNLCLEIPLALFRFFDCGKRITQSVPVAWDLRQGDLVKWSCLEFSGLAKVIECRSDGNNLICVFQEP